MDNEPRSQPPPDGPPGQNKPTKETKLFANESGTYNGMAIQVSRFFYAETDDDAEDLVRSGKATVAP